MVKSHYFEVDNFHSSLHEDCENFKKSHENFYLQVESRLLTLGDELDFAASNENNKMRTYMKLKESVETSKKEIAIELSNDNSEAYQNKDMSLEEMQEEKAKFLKNISELSEKHEVLRRIWHEKSLEMHDIQRKMKLKLRDLKKTNKLFQKKLSIELVPITKSSNSYELIFLSEDGQNLSISCQLINGILELENININTENKEAILSKAQSSSDYQGLLALMNSLRMVR